MTEPADSISNDYALAGLVFDLYFAECARNPVYRRTIAIYEWQRLHPKQRQQLQRESQRFAAGNMRLSEDYTQSVLLLERIKRLVSQSRMPVMPD